PEREKPCWRNRYHQLRRSEFSWQNGFLFFLYIKGPKSQVPRAFAINIARGFIDTAMSPATSVFIGELGTIAADISTTAPIRLIMGETGQSLGSRNQWISMPRAKAMSTMYTCPRSRMNLGGARSSAESARQHARRRKIQGFGEF